MSNSRDGGLYYNNLWITLKIIEILFEKKLICEELWTEVKKNYIAHFTNTS